MRVDHLRQDEQASPKPFLSNTKNGQNTTPPHRPAEENITDDDMSIVPGAPWAFIAVMGVTGSGKSTFIRTVSGDDTVIIGDGLKSCTSELRGYSFHFGGYNVNLIDSPGFNDTYRSETEILQDIALWLKETYEGRNALTGIIYLHGINHSRMEGSALRNLMMFRELCGPDPLKNVILATTFWSQTENHLGVARESELATTPEFWGEMLRRGSSMKRFTDRQSALKMVSGLLQNTPEPLRIQKELVEDRKSLIETAAGQVVNEELQRLEEKHKNEKIAMQKALEEALEQRDKELQDILEEQQQRVEESLDKVHRQQEQLKADRRAENRKLRMELENELFELRAENEKLMKSLSKDGSKVRQYEQIARQDSEAFDHWAGMSPDEIVAKIRAEESTLRAEEREKLEAEISKLKQQNREKWKARAKKGGEWLLIALRAVVPITTLITLGVPITL